MSEVDSVIDIKDLFAELIRKCWLIVICMIIFAIGFSGYKYMKNVQIQQGASAEIMELTEEDKETALEYVSMVQQYESLKEYCEKSILFTFNPYNVYQTELQYIIGGDVKADDVATIRAAYADYVLFGRLASDIASNHKKYTEKALREIIDTDYVIREQGETLKTVRIMVYAKDKKQSQTLVKFVKEQIESYSDEINQTVGTHRFTLLDENTTTIIKNDVKDTKNHYENSMKSLESEIEISKEKLGVVQIEYALDLLGEENEKIEVEVEQEIGLKSIFIFLILGSIVGGTVGIAIIIVPYFFSDQIKTAKEIENIYYIKHFGNCSLDKRNSFERLADKFFYKNDNFDTQENLNAIVSNVSSFCKENSKKNIYFVGKADKEMKVVLEKISIGLKKEMIEGILLENITEMRDLSENIISIMKIKRTTVQEINEEIEFCEKQNLKICGYITFSK